MADKEDQEPGKTTCCLYRRKILVGVMSVLPEEVCGVPDSELADVLEFGAESPTGHPVLAFRYCPWCGKPYTRGSETRITDVRLEDEEPGL